MHDVINQEYIKVYTRIEQLAERIGLMLRKKVIETLDTDKKNDTGNLRKSINYQIENETDRIIVTVAANMRYAPYVHEGTRPHFPPIEPIARWVKSRGIGQSFNSKNRMIGTKKRMLQYKVGRGEVQSQGKYSKEVMSIAWLIARSISRKGTKGFKFFDISLKAAEPEINRMVQNFRVKL